MATLTPTTQTTSAISGVASHVGAVDNPHSVTAEQVGALSTGSLGLAVTNTDVTLTTSQFSNNSFDITGTLTANVAIIVPNNVAQSFVVDNLTTGSFTLTIKHAGTVGVAVVQGISQLLYTNGITVEAVEAAATAHTHVAADTTDFQATVSVNTDVAANKAHTSTVTGNPHAVTKVDVGLGNADNTSDVNKPVSTAQQTALNLKATLDINTEVVELSAGAAAEVAAGRPTNVKQANGTWAAKITETSASGSAIIPVGTTAQRDGTPAVGYQRWNTTLGSMEVWDGAAWSALGGGGKILQVVGKTITTQGSQAIGTTDTQLGAGSDFQLAITPKGNSSKFIIEMRWFGEMAVQWDNVFNVLRDGVRVNNPSTSNMQGIALGAQTHDNGSNDSSTPESMTLSTLDASGSTAGVATTFSLVASGSYARTCWTNRCFIAGAETGVSEIIITEIAA